MNYRPLDPAKSVRVSEISLGCWTMGGLNWVDGKANGWADVDEAAITAAIKLAVDAGVNHFDNADVYGNGRAERMLARVLRKLGLRSTDFVIASKVGHHRGTSPHGFDPYNIRTQCEKSLRNLERDYLDIYYLHHGDFGEQGEWLAGAAETLDALVQEGKVRLKGQSAYSDEHFGRAVPVVRPAVLQSWANPLRPDFIRPGSFVAGLLEKYDMSFVAFSPLQQGLLLDKFDPEHPPQFAEGDNRRDNERFAAPSLRDLRRRLARIKARFGATTEDLSAVAQRYVLSHPRVACTIPGFRSERQVGCNLAATDRRLSAADLQFITEVFA